MVRARGECDVPVCGKTCSEQIKVYVHTQSGRQHVQMSPGVCKGQSIPVCLGVSSRASAKPAPTAHSCPKSPRSGSGASFPQSRAFISAISPTSFPF